MIDREFFPPTSADLPATSDQAEPAEESAAEPSAPLDTQASSLVAAVEASAKGESTTATKLKVTNPDPDVGDDWVRVRQLNPTLPDSRTTDSETNHRKPSKSRKIFSPTTTPLPKTPKHPPQPSP